MLVITAGYPDERSGSWHTGETMNIPEGRVVTFQADGDELYFLIAAIKAQGVSVQYPAEHLTPIL